jgi:Reverse transcriptase (RNA-dependent DNA polymerase)
MDPDTSCSFWPVSNLSYLSKLIEHVVVKRFTAHMSSHSLFLAQQSVYCAFHSTEIAVLSVHNVWVWATDSNQVSLLVMLDLSASFDTVDHNILLSVLSRRFNVTDRAFAWFQSYIDGRSQCFIHHSRQASSYEVDCSVPQGSVLGPVEFVAYTEDIADVVDQHHVRLHFYADDTQLYDICRLQDISNMRNRLSGCAAYVSAWCASRRLQLNADKTETIWFGSKAKLGRLCDQERCVQIGSKIVSPVSGVRDLGAHVDSELSMKQHVSRIAATCFFHLRRLRQIRHCIGSDCFWRS